MEQLKHPGVNTSWLSDMAFQVCYTTEVTCKDPKWMFKLGAAAKISSKILISEFNSDQYALDYIVRTAAENSFAMHVEGYDIILTKPSFPSAN